MKVNIYQEITNKIIEQLEKGAKAEYVCFWKMYNKEETITNEEGTQEKKIITIPNLKYYQVFHEDDIIGYVKPNKKETETIKPIEKADKIIFDYIIRSKVHFQFDKLSQSAYYSPGLDEVVVPNIKQYTQVEEYYSTIFHELTHSTGIRIRLNRGLEQCVAFGSEDYSKEELIAEIGSAMITNTCGIESNKSFRNNIAYIQEWLRVLKGDNKIIVSAASKAEKAVKYILSGEKD